MATTAVATLQTPWDCRWSRPGYRLTGVNDWDQPEPAWVCVRTGHRKPISGGDCDGCPHWEEDQQGLN
jgi:hypothetical protein